MNAKIQAMPQNLLDENFEFRGHPADLEQIIENAIEQYNELPLRGRDRKQYRSKLNELIDQLAEMRGIKQFSHVH